MRTDQLIAATLPGARPPGWLRPDPDSPDTLDGLFASTARRAPRAIAVRGPDTRLGYAAVDTKAGQLATLLLHRQVQLGEPVIVHCSDHPQSLLAQLAVLRVGGVCVPVPAHADPAEITAAAEISGASTVLCSRAQLRHWRDRYDALALDDAEVWRLMSMQRVDRALPLSSPHGAAYLLVSVRNGEPCGELIDHRAWLLALAARTRFAGPASSQVLLSLPPQDRIALSAMWWAFAGGGTLYLPPPGSARHRPLPAPRAVAVLASEEYERALPTLPVRPRTVILLGGPVPRPLAAHHFALLPTTRLVHEFAPAGSVLPWTVTEFPADGRTPSGYLGAPSPGVRVRALDADGRPLPPGTAGELRADGAALPFETIRRVRASTGYPFRPAVEAAPDRGPHGRLLRDGAVELTTALG